MLIDVALVLLVATVFAPWPLDKLAAPVLFACALSGGFLWGLAVRR